MALVQIEKQEACRKCLFARNTLMCAYAGCQIESGLAEKDASKEEREKSSELRATKPKSTSPLGREKARNSATPLPTDSTKTKLYQVALPKSTEFTFL